MRKGERKTEQHKCGVEQCLPVLGGGISTLSLSVLDLLSILGPVAALDGRGCIGDAAAKGYTGFVTREYLITWGSRDLRIYIQAGRKGVSSRLES